MGKRERVCLCVFMCVGKRVSFHLSVTSYLNKEMNDSATSYEQNDLFFVNLIERDNP